jgi:hypothetical protein
VSQPVESFIPVGTQNVRQFQLVVLQPGGGYSTVQIEAVAIVDAITGRTLDLEVQDWRDETLWCLRGILKSLTALCAAQDIEIDLDGDMPGTTEG